MPNSHNHSIRVKRAIALSILYDVPSSAAAMVRAIPEDVVSSISARLLAQVIDANWRLAQEAKAIAARDAVREGIIWDADQQRHRVIA